MLCTSRAISISNAKTTNPNDQACRGRHNEVEEQEGLHSQAGLHSKVMTVVVEMMISTSLLASGHIDPAAHQTFLDVLAASDDGQPLCTFQLIYRRQSDGVFCRKIGGCLWEEGRRLGGGGGVSHLGAAHEHGAEWFQAQGLHKVLAGGLAAGEGKVQGFEGPCPGKAPGLEHEHHELHALGLHEGPPGLIGHEAGAQRVEQVLYVLLLVAVLGVPLYEWVQHLQPASKLQQVHHR